MTTTLSYNPRNKMAQRTMDYILSLGVFKVEDNPTQKKKRSLANEFHGAMKEVQAAESGKIKLRTLSELINEL